MGQRSIPWDWLFETFQRIIRGHVLKRQETWFRHKCLGGRSQILWVLERWQIRWHWLLYIQKWSYKERLLS